MRVRGIIVAAVAAMLSLPAHAQSVPPQVPRYNCYLTPAIQQQAHQWQAEMQRWQLMNR